MDQVLKDTTPADIIATFENVDKNEFIIYRG